jgi:hypothetical protein
MTSSTKIKLIIAVVLGLTVLGVGTAALWRVDWYGDGRNELSPRFDYDLQAYAQVDPALVKYRASGEWPLDLQHPRGIATGPEDRVYVAGDRHVLVLDSEGQVLATRDVPGEPTCLTVGSADHKFPGAVYAGLSGRIVRLDDRGDVAAQWTEGLNEKTLLTSLAVADEDLFAADAGNRIVLRYDLTGKLVGRIGQRDPEHHVPGFIIPSPYFDIAVAAGGLLRVVNPGASRLETYTFDGDLMGFWGQAASGIEGFFGCCNPAHIALLADGRVVTVEKGLPRVKVYSGKGEFECVVATPQDLAPGTITEDTRDDTRQKPFDVAADRGGRVLLLDAHARRVRVFVRKP